MTKPREKTREELTAEIEESKKKIRQLENREKVLRQMIILSQKKGRGLPHGTAALPCGKQHAESRNAESQGKKQGHLGKV